MPDRAQFSNDVAAEMERLEPTPTLVLEGRWVVDKRGNHRYGIGTWDFAWFDVATCTGKCFEPKIFMTGIDLGDHHAYQSDSAEETSDHLCKYVDEFFAAISGGRITVRHPEPPSL